MRVFLECLYGTVGFIPLYQRERNEGEIRGSNHDLERGQLVTAETEKVGIEPEDVNYLVGEGSGYKMLRKAHHAYLIRVAAIHLERRMKRYTLVSRAKTIERVWTYMTGYEIFEDAYKNINETRRPVFRIADHAGTDIGDRPSFCLVQAFFKTPRPRPNGQAWW